MNDVSWKSQYVRVVQDVSGTMFLPQAELGVWKSDNKNLAREIPELDTTLGLSALWPAGDASYSVYTTVSYFSDWIHTIIEKTESTKWPYGIAPQAKNRTSAPPQWFPWTVSIQDTQSWHLCV